MDGVKLCKDCKHSVGRSCVKGEMDYVTGGPSLYAGWRGNCQLQREDGPIKAFLMGTCGTNARWFEQR